MKVGVARNLALHLVPRRVHEPMEESLDILEVAHLLNSKEAEVIPLSRSPLRVAPDPTEQVRRQTDVVQSLPPMQHVDTRVAPHYLAKARFKNGTLQDTNG